MNREKHVLIISDDESGNITRIVENLKALPIIRTSMISVINVLRHHVIDAIVIDHRLELADPIEIILNVMDVNPEVPIIVPEKFEIQAAWKKIKKIAHLSVYSKNELSIQQKIKAVLNNK